MQSGTNNKEIRNSLPAKVRQGQRLSADTINVIIDSIGSRTIREVGMKYKGATGGTTEDETKLAFGLTDSASSVSVTAGNVRWNDKTSQLSTTAVPLVGSTDCYVYVKINITARTAEFFTDVAYLDNTSSFIYWPLARYTLTGTATYTRVMRYWRGGDINIASVIS